MSEKLPKGWSWFTSSYRMDDGSWWSFEIAAQSQEDAETRIRCIRASDLVATRAIPGQPERFKRRYCKCGHVDSLHGLVGGSHPRSCCKCKCLVFDEVNK